MQNRSENHPPATRGDWWAAVLSLAVLTAITAVISYEHAYEVFRAAHNTGVLAVLGPVVPDLVIAVCSMAMLAAARSDAGQPRTAIAALVAFVGVTVALNAVAGLKYGRGAALLAVLAPVGYLAGLHILTGMIRRGRGTVSPGVKGGALATFSHAGPAEPLSTDEVLRLLVATDSRRGLAAALGVPKSRVDSWAARTTVVADDSPAGVAAGPLVTPAGASLNGQGSHG